VSEKTVAFPTRLWNRTMRPVYAEGLGKLFRPPTGRGTDRYRRLPRAPCRIIPTVRFL
jgi:hypothetical protein